MFDTDLLLSDKNLPLAFCVMKTDLSIVVPAFDEQDRVGDSIRKILGFIESEKLDAELIVVDDGSGDNTAKIAEEACAETPGVQSKVIRYEQNRGKGFAIKTGLLAATADIALFSDADLSTPIDELSKLVDPIRTGEFDVTFGSRALDRSLIGRHQPRFRESGGILFNMMVRILLGLDIEDTQCGFKLFSAEAVETLFHRLTISGFAFDVELLVMARQAGFDVQEVGIVWHGRADSRVAVSRGAAAFGDVLRVRWNALIGRYGPRTSRPPSPRGIRRSSSSSPSSTAAAPSPR